MKDLSEHKGDRAQPASSEQLTRATLDHQAEIVRLNAIHKSTAEALVTMEIQN